jgi:hypothetical protein
MDILKLEIQKKRKELEEKKLLVRCRVTNFYNIAGCQYFF